MLLSIVGWYVAIGVIFTEIIDISARVGSERSEDDRSFCETIDKSPIGSRINLILCWPSWVIRGIINGLCRRF